VSVIHINCKFKTNTAFMKLTKLLRIIGLPILLLCSIFAFAQDKVVSGRVTDANGNGIGKVTVQARGARAATSTNDDGSFSLRVPQNTTALIFTSVGFDRQEVNLNDQATLNVRLNAAATNLSEVVVVGYGTQRKKDVTGSITKVDGAKLANVPTASFESALAGKAAGVQVIPSNGMAGSGAVVRIRGAASVSLSTEPLYVIDGIPIDNTFTGTQTRNQVGQDRNPLANINPNDIESVEILKDAAAAGIYGSRGANGVVLITTKRGKGKMKVNYTARVGYSEPALKPKFVDKDTWLALRQEAWEMDGNTGPQQNLPGRTGGFPLQQALSNPGTDWWGLLSRKGVSHEHNVSLSQGTKYVNYYVGLNYNNSQSYVVANDFRRMGARANVDFKPINNLTVGVNASYTDAFTNLTNNGWNGGLSFAMGTALPYYPVKDAQSGQFFKADGSGLTWGFGSNNPFFQNENSKFRNTEKRTILGGSISYQPIKNLDLRATITSEKNNSVFNSYYNGIFQGRTSVADGTGSENISKYTNTQYNGTAQYTAQLNNLHKFVVLAGFEYQEQLTRGAGFTLNNNVEQPFFDSKSAAYDSATGKLVYGTSYNMIFRSVFGRVNYSFKDRYQLQGSLRRDESSIFRGNNTAAYFPTISAAWIISDEGFMKDQNLFNYLKLRGGWGLVGNAGIPWDAGYPNADTSRSPGAYYNGQPIIFRNNLGNPDLKWETSYNYDIALEFGILKNRISGEIAYYNKESKDLLLDVPVSIYNGVGGNQWQNQGRLRNRGIEFSLNTINVKSTDFTWTTNFNISHNENKVLDLGGLRPDAIGGGTNETRVVPGYPVGTIFTVRFYGVDPADGLPIYLDKNGNLTKRLNVDPLSGDKVPVASVYPDATGGLTNTFKYKNLELSTLFTYQIGGHIWDNSGKRNMGYITDWNIYSFYVGNYWRKPGDIAKYPRPTLAGYSGIEGNPWDNNTSLQVYEQDFIRLKEVTLNYYLPEKLTRKLHMSAARIYVSGYNLFLFTKYPVGDPEVSRDSENITARNQSPNTNFLTLPQARTFNFGINVNF
jgi:TonB-linked SusC/RagA family outer membrane protein